MNDIREEKLFHISTSPHIRSDESVRTIMLLVIIALLPATAASIFFFGIQALYLTAVCVAASVLTEWGITALRKKPRTVSDLSAVITGMLIAFNLPEHFPLWMAALGSVFAIGVAKMAFGGLGHNFINPALAGRAFLMASYPAALTTFPPPRSLFAPFLRTGADAATYATPLAHLKSAAGAAGFDPSGLREALAPLFWGDVGGCIGETSAAALLLGACLLWYKRIIGPRIPLSYIATVFLLAWVSNPAGTHFSAGAWVLPLYHILGGGLMLGALFMATDMTTSPLMPRGKIVFGIGCGILTFMIRTFGGYPEGVSYSILLMNVVVPLIDRYTRPRRYGEAVRDG